MVEEYIKPCPWEWGFAPKLLKWRWGAALGACLAVVIASLCLSPTPVANAAHRATSAESTAVSVFYSGRGNAGMKDAKGHATWRLNESKWTTKPKCSTANAIPDTNGRPVKTLAGYSLGRLGPVYYLDAASSEREASLRYIILFDPGALGEFSDQDSCDRRFDIDGLLATWLKRNQANRLLVMAGDKSLDVSAGSLYLGLRSHYLRKIATQGLARQALVCNAESNGVPYRHKDVMKEFARLISEGSGETCPSGFYGWRPGTRPYANTIVQWNADAKPQKTAWLVGADGNRRWIPDIGTYNCIAAKTGPPRVLMASVLDLLPDQRGVRAECASAQPPPPPPPPATFTQIAPVNIDPNTQAYGGVVNVWSRPARNDFCNSTFPTCDPASTQIYQVAHGQMVTAVCVVPNGQRIITGTATNPGYDDRRWVALTTGGYLPNTWWARTGISPSLPLC